MSSKLVLALFIALLASGLFAAGPQLRIIDSCQNLSDGVSTQYRLNRSVNISNGTCFTFLSSNHILDCNGYSITGNNATGAYAVYSDQLSSQVKNCLISNFSHGIYFNGVTGSQIQNSTVNTTRGLSDAIHLEGGSSILSSLSLSSMSGGGSSGCGLFANATDLTVSNIFAESDSNAGACIYSATSGTINGLVATSDGGYGIYLDSSTGMTFLNINANSTSNTGFYLTGSSSNFFTSNISVSSDTGSGLALESSSDSNEFNDLTASTSGGSGAIYINGAASNNFNNTTATGGASATAAINMESSADSTTFTHLRVDSLSYAVHIASSNYATFTDANLSSNESQGLYLDTASNYGNYSQANSNSNHSYSFYMANSVGNLFSDSAFTGGTTDAVFALDSADYCANSFTNVSGTGGKPVLFYNSSQNLSNLDLSSLVICNGTASNISNVNATGSGIQVLFSNRSAISDVNVSNLDNYGLYLYGSSGSRISNITAVSDTGYAIYSSSSPNSTLTNATVSSNGGATCIFFLSSDGANISKVKVSGYATGVSLENSPDSNITDLNSTANMSAVTVTNSNRSSVSAIRGLNYTKTHGLLVQNTAYISLSNISVMSNESTSAGIFMSICHFCNLTGISATALQNTGIYLTQCNNNTIRNSTAASSAYEAIQLSAGNGTSILGNTLDANGTNNALYLTNAINSTVLGNTIRGDSWVYSNGGSGNTFNNSSSGNTYYLKNGTGAWAVYDILDMDGDNWADAGSALPFNNTTVAGRWNHTGEDCRPYVQRAASGNASSVNTTITGLNVTIGGTGNFTGKGFANNSTVNFTTPEGALVSFNYDFASSSINFSAVSIENGTSGGAAYASISGINSSFVVGTKTITLHGANPAYAQVCIRDENGATHASISAACTGENEHIVSCDGTLQNGYNCSLSGTTLTIAGLNHSAVSQFSPPASSSSSVGGTSYSTPTLTYTFNCTSGLLSVSAKNSGVPIPGLGIHLKKFDEFAFINANTGSNGVAHFTISENHKYTLESAQTGAYSPASVSALLLTLCGVPTQPSANETVPPVIPSQPAQNTSNQTAPLLPVKNDSTPTSQPPQKSTAPQSQQQTGAGAQAGQGEAAPASAPATDFGAPLLAMGLVGAAVAIFAAAYLALSRKKKR